MSFGLLPVVPSPWAAGDCGVCPLLNGDCAIVFRSMTSFFTLGRLTNALGLIGASSPKPLVSRRGDARPFGVPDAAELVLEPSASGLAPMAAPGADDVDEPKPRKRVILVADLLTGVPLKDEKIGGFFFSSAAGRAEAPAVL